MAHANPTADQSASELKNQIELERDQLPFLVHREPAGSQRLTPLGSRERMTIGRGDGVQVALDGDESVSRVHAELELVGDAWVVSDDGLSRNGTFVNGERVIARRRLSDRDLIMVGGTGILYRDPSDPATASGPPPTVAAGQGSDPAPVTPLGEMQRKVLVSLCRPLGGERSFAAAPATNQEISDELYITVSAVKSHLRTLFEKFDLDELPQNRKRVALAEHALREGIVLPAELSG